MSLHRIITRNDTAAVLTTRNEVLLDGEWCAEKNTGKYKIGDGISTWNALPYAGQFTLANATDVLFTNIAEPVTPAADTAKLFMRKIAGRMRPMVKGPAGLATMLGTDQATNFSFRVLPAAGAAVTVLGNSGVAVGTLSSPNPTEQYGYMTNFITAATANATCGYSATTAIFLRGSVVGANGFEYSARLAFPDASYDQTAVTTGTRIFAGLSDQTFSTGVVNVDAPTGHFAGFRRNHVNAGQLHTNWQFQTRDGTTTFSVDTGMPFAVGKVYDFRMFCGPQGNAIGWHIMNLTDNIEASGSVTTNLPGAAIYMRPGFQILTINALARNVRQQLLTCESER